MNKDELRELLHQEYKTENWKKVTEFVFPNVQYLQRPQAIPFSNDEVESFKQIGNVKLTDGKNLAMFEVKVAQNVNLVRSRVKLRKLVENLIDQERNHGVLVIYEQGKEDYRFTFTAKSTEFDEEENDFVDLETDAKRFTYILGKNESCKTAANRFWELSTHKDKATIKDVENAFSVERLNKEFFNKYKEFYEDFVQYITGKRFVKEKGKWVEKKIGRAKPVHKEVFESDDKLARNFVKLLLGRLVFIQFLQKKGWMGVPATSEHWKNGDPDFLLNLYNTAKNKEEFHSKCLYALFYKAFNTPNRANDVFALTGSRVPYLNGGLFENENPKTKEIDFPANYFANLLDFFGQYNFTIDENDPLDHEVGIDPEMLGHIFENLLEDNKDKGAFYTPKPIVQYMCQESLIQYLKTYLQEQQLWPLEVEAASQTDTNLQNFVRKKIAGELLNDYDEHLAKALKEVKICDPAIGSGAFPMGLLNEIFYCMQVLHDASPDTVGAVWEMEEWAPDIVKKNIIQHSIYGVDIEKGAVDIARLRFWLSLIVDEQEPTPLPNLDFKIMQGNSLLESYEGIDLSKIAGTKTIITEVALDLFGNPVNAQTSIFDTKYIDDSNISELIDNYFNTQLPDEKQKLKKEIDFIIHKHIDFNLEFEENKILISIADIKKNLALLKADKNHSLAVAAKTTKSREKLLKELEKIQQQLDELKLKRKELHDLQKTAERPYFLWHLFFKDVFEKGGFDIVIANPPYGAVLNEQIKDVLKNKYHHLVDRIRNTYLYFQGLSFDLLKEKGNCCLIIPNEFLFQIYMTTSRNWFLKNTDVSFAINLGDGVFQAIVPSCIIGFNKEMKDKSEIKLADLRKIESERLELSLKGNIYSKTTKEHILSSPNAAFSFDLETSSILNRLMEKGKPFESFCEDVANGISTSCDSVYIITEEFAKQQNFEKAYLKPTIRGGQFKKFYCPKTTGEFVLYVTSDFSKSKAPNIQNYLKSHKELLIKKSVEKKSGIRDWHVLFRPRYEELFQIPKIMIRQTGDKIIACEDNVQRYYCIDSVNIATIKEEHRELISYLIGVLNSKLFLFIYKEISQESGRILAQVKPQRIKMLPIVATDETVKRIIVKKVEKITKLKSENPDSDISSLETEIDYLVFKLYDISYEDLQLIDSDSCLSKEEFIKLTTINA